jgi:4-amino-4-deoxy-L-arabinose transferase-like glycosyltransferase
VRACTEGAKRVEVCLILFYLSLALGLLAKGPPLFLHLGISLAAFHFCFRRRIPGTIKSHLVGIALLLLVALPWVVYVLSHVKNAMELWRYESVGELADNVENARPWWFYLPNIFFIALPWTAAAITGVFVVVGRPKIRRRRLFPLLWLAVTVLFFSIVHLKKNPYLLPAMPAQTLLIAEGLAAALAVAARARRVTWGGIVLAIQSAIGIACAVALIVVVITQTAHPPWAIAISVIVLLASCLPVVLLQMGNPRRWVRWQVAACVLLTLGLMFGVETAMDNDRSAKSLCVELTVKAEAPGTAILRSRLPEEVAVYLPIDLDDREAMATHFLVVQDDQFEVEKRKKKGGAPPIPPPETYASSFPNGQVIFVDRVPMKSAPGDARWKVYELTVERFRYAQR